MIIPCFRDSIWYSRSSWDVRFLFFLYDSLMCQDSLGILWDSWRWCSSFWRFSRNFFMFDLDCLFFLQTILGRGEVIFSLKQTKHVVVQNIHTVLCDPSGFNKCVFMQLKWIDYFLATTSPLSISRPQQRKSGTFWRNISCLLHSAKSMQISTRVRLWLVPWISLSLLHHSYLHYYYYCHYYYERKCLSPQSFRIVDRGAFQQQQTFQHSQQLYIKKKKGKKKRKKKISSKKKVINILFI